MGEKKISGMKKDCDSCGFYNRIAEGCGSVRECKIRNRGYAEWIPISQRRVLSGVIRNICKKQKGRKDEKYSKNS